MPQAIPAVCVRRTSISVQVLPFGLSLSPRVFTKVAEAALVSLREQGVCTQLPRRLAQSQDQLCKHRDLVLSHLSQLGLRVNWEKSKLLPMQRISFLGMEFGFCQSDSAPHAGTRSVVVELLEYVQEQDGGTTETVSEAPGAYGGCGGGHTAGSAPYETASTLAPGPSPEVGVAERHAAGPNHSSLPPNLHPVVRPFIPSGRSDSSSSGVGSAIHIPGLLNWTPDELSRAALPGEWRLHPQTVQLIWRRFGLAQVDPFASLETSHCQLFYSLTGGTLGTDALAHSWPQGLRKYAFPPVSLLAQTLCKVREEEEQILLVAPYWPTQTWFPELMLLVTAPPWQIPLRKDLLPQRRGTLWHPRPDLWKFHVWSLDGTRRF